MVNIEVVCYLFHRDVAWNRVEFQYDQTPVNTDAAGRISIFNNVSSRKT